MLIVCVVLRDRVAVSSSRSRPLVSIAVAFNRKLSICVPVFSLLLSWVGPYYFSRACLALLAVCHARACTIRTIFFFIVTVFLPTGHI